MKFLTAIAFIAVVLSAAPAFAGSVYDRVMESGKIRCGYTLYSIGLNRDINSGDLWGIIQGCDRGRRA